MENGNLASITTASSCSMTWVNLLYLTLHEVQWYYCTMANYNADAETLYCLSFIHDNRQTVMFSPLEVVI